MGVSPCLRSSPPSDFPAREPEPPFPPLRDRPSSDPPKSTSRMGFFTSNPTSSWRGSPKSGAQTDASCPTNFPASGGPQLPFPSLDTPVSAPHKSSFSPKPTSPWRGPQNPGAQVGTSSHRCVQGVYGGSLPHGGVSLTRTGGWSLGCCPGGVLRCSDKPGPVGAINSRN